MKRTFILAILDGWGLGNFDASNPIYMAHPEAMNFIHTHFPSCALQASGIAAGLPWEEEGNSEVGHITIGAGKIIYQHLPRISLSVEDGSFFENENLKKAFAHAKKNDSAVHLVGLLTAGNVHASMKHLAALIDMAKKEHCEKLYLQLISDGRDSPPHSLLELIERLREELTRNNRGVISSISGRYYAMNRDEHWDRTERAYRVLVGLDTTQRATTIAETTTKTYADQSTDEFIEPWIIGDPHPISDNDAVIFFNFREDSMRQIVEPFVSPSFSKFKKKQLKNIQIVTMTSYRNDFAIPVAFPNETVEYPLGRVLAEQGKTQLRIAETQKYAHVTYFFNGLREEPFPNEFRVLIPSLNVPHPEEKPDMMASAITDRVLAALSENAFDVIVINYANADIIAHTGNYDASLKAVAAIDREIKRLLEKTLAENHILLVTSDHGNAEVLIDLKTGQAETKHNPNPVPFYVVAKEFELANPHPERYRPESIGLLADVAPTLLALMNLPKPPEMTGQNLVDQMFR